MRSCCSGSQAKCSPRSTDGATLLNRHVLLLSAGVRRFLWAASCALFLLLLSSLVRVPDVPAAVIGALFAFVLLAAYRPAGALVAVVALIPIASWTGRHWNGSIAWPETIAVAFLAGYAAHQALERHVEPADAPVYAIHGMIAVIAGSLAVELMFLQATLGGEGLRHVLTQLVSRDYFIGDGGFQNGDAAMRLVEGLLLAHAGATLARSSSPLGPRLVRALVAGAGVAGVLTLWRVWLGALRADEPVLAFLRFLATIRFNAHYGDVNAAGSYYVMAVLPALALALTKFRWALAAAVLVLSLSLTGSRAAFIAGPVALAIVWFRARQSTTILDPARGRLWLRRAAGTVLVLVCAAMLYAGIARNVTPVALALDFRREFTLTALRMFASRPLFGVGVGAYREHAAEFSSARLRAAFQNENAHNNFLQILAEAGAVGFAAFAVLMVVATRRADRLLSTSVPAGTTAFVGGLLAFVLTCLAGHPFIIDEPALTFWLLLGAAAGWGTARRWTDTAAVRWIAFVLVLVVAVSIPTRARQEFGAANLEHLGIGLSSWQADADGIRYRTAGASSTVFVPADAQVISVPLRAIPPGSSLEVQLFLDGRQANAVRVSSEMWRAIAVPMPQHRDGPRFRALELKIVNGPSSHSDLLMIGKVDPH